MQTHVFSRMPGRERGEGEIRLWVAGTAGNGTSHEARKHARRQNRLSSRDGGCFEMETLDLSDSRDASVAGAGPLIGLLSAEM